MTRRWIRTGVVAMACAALAACGEAVIIREAGPGTEKTAVTIPSGGVVNPRNWPDACALISDAEITGLLPQAKRIQRTPEWVKIPPDEAFGGKAGAGLAPNGACKYSFTLPQNGDYKSGYEGSGGIRIDIAAVGDPKSVAGHFARTKSEYGQRNVVTEVDAKVFGAAECFAWVASGSSPRFTVCRRGPVMIESLDVGFSYIDFENADRNTPAFKKIIDERLTPAFFRAATANF
ncbi:hypothetical protein [Thermomonospora umbrina]|uniref:Lipoprotein n=1 Tax=Thermomonospora umbrina TaxID=111806 RepID=A0A3D9T0W0_9ACTN|nr:hypothetical protein [Thermomonospora umbrina]REF00451.1 hypothetical protein DFJ69_5988 [Thermomonospora umbrina]